MRNKILLIGVKKDLPTLVADLREARKWLRMALNGQIDTNDRCIERCEATIHSLHRQIINYPTSEKWQK